ncbi:hypothetical protein ACO0SA_003741 [Hanseniaspora valbyensis]
MLRSKLPEPIHSTGENQQDVIKFNRILYNIFDEVLNDYNKEKKRTSHLHGFKRTIDPDYRVPFPKIEDIKECEIETMKIISLLKSDKNKRPNSSTIDSDNNNTHFDPLKPNTENKNKRKYTSEENVDIIENTTYSQPLSSKSNKKLKLTNVKAKDIPESISQYSFRTDVINPLEKTFANKVAKPTNLSGKTQANAETMNIIMNDLEFKHNEKMLQLKEKREKEAEEIKKEQTLRIVQSRLEQANNPRSRFQNSKIGSRFEGHGRRRNDNTLENIEDSESE